MVDPRASNDPTRQIHAYASSSRLFWHTSLSDAQRQAQRTGRPIVSLRLLGRLDEDFSCANCRLFRTVLYPDSVVGKQLREHFILHWSTVRDVPKVTIDFGDGRTLQRPLTGNSVHLVLDDQARPIDAMIQQDLPAETVMPLAVSKSLMEIPVLRMVRQLNQNIARDTAFNLLGLKPKIDDWFAEPQSSGELTEQSLTRRIYADIFLMPLSDPWLGLSPDDQFVALPDAGRVQPKTMQNSQMKSK